MSQPKQVILTGIRPTGPLHLGHLLVLREFERVRAESDQSGVILVADHHAYFGGLTPFEVTRHTRTACETILSLMGAWAKPTRFGPGPLPAVAIQSMHPGILDLFIRFLSVTPKSILDQCPTFDPSGATGGSYIYPVLQAADIAFFGAQLVVVGPDQVPHIEIAREIIRRANRAFASDFPEPQAHTVNIPKLPGLDGRKMSKSYQNTIPIGPETLPDGTVIDGNAQARMDLLGPMKTCEDRKRLTDPGDPDRCPVYDLHRCFTGAERLADIADGCRGARRGCVQCKTILNGEIGNTLTGRTF